MNYIAEGAAIVAGRALTVALVVVLLIIVGACGIGFMFGKGQQPNQQIEATE